MGAAHSLVNRLDNSNVSIQMEEKKNIYSGSVLEIVLLLRNELQPQQLWLPPP